MEKIGRLERVVSRAKAETMPPRDSGTAETVTNTFKKFPEIERMTIEQSEHKIRELEEQHETIRSWGDLIVADRKLLATIEDEIAAHKENIASKRLLGDGMRRAA